MGTNRDRRRAEQAMPWFVPVLLVATYGLTIWQARWGYFFVLIFALALPALLAPIKSRAAVWTAFVLSIYPILRDWDQMLWPNETQLSRRMEQRYESAQIRDLALSLQSSETRPFLAPWWLSICKQHAKFSRNTRRRGFLRTIPNAWRKIPQPS